VACGGSDRARSRRPAVEVLEERLRGGAAAAPREPRGRGGQAIALSHARKGRWKGGGGVVEVEKDRVGVCLFSPLYMSKTGVKRALLGRPSLFRVGPCRLACWGGGPRPGTASGSGQPGHGG
jgi:hypothetical protein